MYGYLNICPHFSSPLNYRAGEFLNEDKKFIRCTSHFSEFRIEDGYGVGGAAERCWLDPVPVSVKNGMIVIQEPEGAPSAPATASTSYPSGPTRRSASARRS